MKYTEEQLELIELGEMKNFKTMATVQETDNQIKMVENYRENIMLGLKTQKAEVTLKIQELKVENRNTEHKGMIERNNLEIELLKLKLKKIKFNQDFYRIDEKIQKKTEEWKLKSELELAKAKLRLRLG